MLYLDAKRCIQSLNSTTCPACGKTKRRAMSLCGGEYHSLPADLRKALYSPVGQGYESAMARALEFLDVKEFVESPR